jgi:glycosyltransferase involved in cell wall biosynthesis
VCVPSRREGYGMTAREAMAYGRPVVATRVGGLADLEGEGVVLVEPGDSVALRSAVGRLLDDLGAAGLAARTTAAEGFSLAATALKLVEVYEASLRAT